MTKQISWPRVFVEALVIVGSILLALGLEAWWTGAEARREARRALESVLAELGEARVEIERVGGLHGQLLSATTALALRLATVAPDQTVVVTDTLLAGLLITSTTDAPSALIEAFISSGGLDEVENEELRRQLIAWSPVLRDLRDDEAQVRDIMNRDVMPYLWGEFDMEQARNVSVAWARGRPRSESGGSDYQTQVRSTLRLRNLVGQQAVWFDLLNGQSLEAVVRLRTLSDLVRLELN